MICADQYLPSSYAVDWWSFGTLLFEMLVGMTPFWAPNHVRSSFAIVLEWIELIVCLFPHFAERHVPPSAAR